MRILLVALTVLITACEGTPEVVETAEQYVDTADQVLALIRDASRLLSGEQRMPVPSLGANPNATGGGGLRMPAPPTQRFPSLTAQSVQINDYPNSGMRFVVYFMDSYNALVHNSQGQRFQVQYELYPLDQYQSELFLHQPMSTAQMTMFFRAPNGGTFLFAPGDGSHVEGQFVISR